ncbi:GntR family transcriptional regulator [Roseicyclus sp. F158]|uniref:GntR family transcriptional regulator n=1 Tax=Tropicimonas omnivorans TaxID=3075590 RepID=A0ABU3DD33_9RHOB|nr:GntR family transcriptional regulator [Roseicyclus sp. F158]MDT0681625.1 GntR family transcriptional regulator [Roseicyclus sp. F158]
MALPTFQPVGARRTVQDQVYSQLREALISGVFEAGESFTISALAEKFNTSHMPIREALRRLAAENALRISTSGTAYVPAIDVAEFMDITRARGIVEPAAAEIAFDALRTRQDELRALQLRHEQEGLAGRISAMLGANRDFHFFIYEAADSPVLVSQIENLWLRSGAYVRFLSDRMGELLKTSYAQDFAKYHNIMLDALAEGDRKKFRDTVYGDILATQSLLADVLQGGK